VDPGFEAECGSCGTGGNDGEKIVFRADSDAATEWITPFLAPSQVGLICRCNYLYPSYRRPTYLRSESNIDSPIGVDRYRLGHGPESTDLGRYVQAIESKPSLSENVKYSRAAPISMK
jgi:hypothetical protein